ncbi:unnamed protein product [Microthlaspi erraticum]|uniref:Uncharacterized protein n=1 Tax=Microthlaspi erraticum TaxID=1685480 RepID=A0A6D2JX03_9BRAS|nr:unnamed protein product [Microthlaspi erraticum]
MSMMPNLRCVAAQVHRSSRSIWPRRNLCSSPEFSSNESNGAGQTVVGWYVRRGLAVAAGFGFNWYRLGDLASSLEEDLQSELRALEETLEESKRRMRRVVNGDEIPRTCKDAFNVTSPEGHREVAL